MLLEMLQRRGFSDQVPTPSRGRCTLREPGSFQREALEALALPAPGTGEPHRVVFKGRVQVRRKARIDAQVIGMLTPGEEVELFSEDHTQRWRSLICFHTGSFSTAHNRVLPGFGWVLVHSDIHGPLLEKGCGKVKRDIALECNVVDVQAGLPVAVQKGLVNETIRLLWAKADADKEDLMGETVLFEAAGTGSVTMLLVLMLARADPAHRSASGMTPLAMGQNPGHQALLAAFAGGRRSLDEVQRLELDRALAGVASEPLVEATWTRLFEIDEVVDKIPDEKVSKQESKLAAQLVQQEEMIRRMHQENEKLRKQIEQQSLHEHGQNQTDPGVLPIGTQHFHIGGQDVGELFRAVFAGGKMAVREEPNSNGKVIDMLVEGDEVRLHEEDETGKWRRVMVSCLHFNHQPGPGWVLLHSESLGHLLEKVDEVLT